MTMDRREREDIAKVIRLRARVAKAASERVAAERLADVEAQLAAQYQADHEAWSQAVTVAEEAVNAANRRIQAACDELGVRKEFRPALGLHWTNRGENALVSRRAELRAVARTQVDAEAKAAKETIEAKCADVLTELVAGGLESDEAKAFLQSLPTPEQLMPALSVAALEAAVPKSREMRALDYLRPVD